MWWRRIRYVLTLLSLCAIATCPSAHRSCRAKVRAREAAELLDVLSAELRRVVASSSLPTHAAAPTPPVTRCCEQGGRCAPDATLWQVEPWRTLRFSLDEPHRYSVEYVPTPNGALIRLLGDVDCDGVLSRYELRATVAGTSVTLERSAVLPLE
ncbi:MAG: hypothetical protein R3B48_02420 [Kofleriaceae bacterium]